MKTDVKLWLKSEYSSFDAKRIKLLEKIEETGSMSKAAKVVGMSYKAAWDAIDKMNNLAEEPLVIKVTGGRQGGGSTLTPFARELIKTFYNLAEARDRTLEQLEDEKRTGISFFMASTKNLFSCHVQSIVSGDVNATVGLKLRGGDMLAAVVTRDSVKRLALNQGDRTYALVHESSISLLKGDGRNLAVSARNRLFGKVSRITTAGVSAEVEIRLPGGQNIYITMTAASIDSMDLQEDNEVTALFKAQNVMILK